MNHSFKLLTQVALATLVCCASTVTSAQNKFVIKLAHSDSADITTSRKAVMAEAFAREIKAKSGGRIEVQIFGAGALGGEKDLVEGVKNGFIQAGLASGVPVVWRVSADAYSLDFIAIY